MAATEKQRFHWCAGADVKRADTFGAVNFVRGNRKQVDAESVHVERNFSGGLDGVGVKPNVGFFRDAADFFERLERADFIVGVHDRDQDSFRAQRIFYRGGVDDACPIYWEKCDVDSALGERLTWIQRGAVLDLRGDDVATHGGFAARDAENCEIVRLGAAAGESDFGGLRSDKRGDGNSCAFHGGASSLPEGMNRAGVAIFGGKIREHHGQDFGVHGRGGVVIEIDAMDVWQGVDFFQVQDRRLGKGWSRMPGN